MRHVHDSIAADQIQRDIGSSVASLNLVDAGQRVVLVSLNLV